MELSVENLTKLTDEDRFQLHTFKCYVNFPPTTLVMEHEYGKKFIENLM